MKMQLTDREIREAVHNYVRDVVGINLTDKTLTITFSATRYEGTIANLDIIPNAAAPTAIASAPVAASTTLPGYGDGTTDTEAAGVTDPVVDPAEPAVAAAAQAEQTLGNPVEEAATLVASASVTDTAAATDVATADAAVADTTVADTTETKPAEVKPVVAKATLFGKPAATTAA